MNNFNYINTLKRKRNEEFSNNQNNLIPSCLGARQVRYVLQYMLV